MNVFSKGLLILLCMGFVLYPAHKSEAVAYVTDTGGYAFDESRAAVNLAPAIALGTIAIVGIIAIAVQNSHGKRSSSSSSSHYSSSSYSHYSSYSDSHYSSYSYSSSSHH